MALGIHMLALAVAQFHHLLLFNVIGAIFCRL